MNKETLEQLAWWQETFLPRDEAPNDYRPSGLTCSDIISKALRIIEKDYQ